MRETHLARRCVDRPLAAARAADKPFGRIHSPQTQSFNPLHQISNFVFGNVKDALAALFPSTGECRPSHVLTGRRNGEHF
jgi:hypothetical protein